MPTGIKFISSLSGGTSTVGIGLSTIVGPTGPSGGPIGPQGFQGLTGPQGFQGGPGPIGGVSSQFIFNNNGEATGSFNALFFTETSTGSNIYASTSIIPSENALYNLGSPDHLWKSIYISTGTIFIGPTGTLGLDNNGIISSAAGFATPFITIGSTSPGNGINLYTEGDKLWFQNQFGASGPVSIWNVASNSINNTFFTGGNIGIGINNPTYPLTVKGTIYCEGLTGTNLPVGPQGNQGLQGNQGFQGNQGPTGPGNIINNSSGSFNTIARFTDENTIKDSSILLGDIGDMQNVANISFNVNTGSSILQGTLYWDNQDNTKTLNLVMGTTGVVQQIGEETYFRIKASAPITNGQVVMFDGTVGASGGLKGKPATGITPSTTEYIMGIATQNMALNEWGYVTYFGIVRDLDTSGGSEGWVDGDLLYYNPSSTGGLTKYVPTGSNPKVLMATVVHSSPSNGSIFVRATFGGELGQFEGDVYIQNKAINDVLIYNGSYWTNQSLASLTGAKGPTGAQGFQGNQGFQGSAGQDGSTTNLTLYLDTSGGAYSVTQTGALMIVPNLGTQTTITSGNQTNTTINIANFISSSVPSTVIAGGNWDLNLFAFANAASAVAFYFEAYYVDADGVSNQTLLAAGTGSSSVFIGTTQGVYQNVLYVPATTLPNTTKRILLKIFLIFTGNNRSATLEFRDGTVSHLHTTIFSPEIASGQNTQVIFNQSGAYTGSSNLTFNNNKLTTSNLHITSSENATGSATGALIVTGGINTNGESVFNDLVYAPSLVGNFISRGNPGQASSLLLNNYNTVHYYSTTSATGFIDISTTMIENAVYEIEFNCYGANASNNDMFLYPNYTFTGSGSPFYNVYTQSSGSPGIQYTSANSSSFYFDYVSGAIGWEPVGKIRIYNNRGGKKVKVEVGDTTAIVNGQGYWTAGAGFTSTSVSNIVYDTTTQWSNIGRLMFSAGYTVTFTNWNVWVKRIM